MMDVTRGSYQHGPCLCGEPLIWIASTDKCYNLNPPMRTAREYRPKDSTYILVTRDDTGSIIYKSRHRSVGNMQRVWRREVLRGDVSITRQSDGVAVTFNGDVLVPCVTTR